MEYGNTGGAEFNWNYSMGGNGGGAAHGIYPQMGQMGQMDLGFGGGQQWLHSNQANSQNYQPTMPHSHSASASPFDDYNHSMMRYTNIPKSEGGSMGQQRQSGGQSMGMGAMGGSYGGYPSSMSRNGLGNPGAGMGHGGNSNYGGSW